MLLLAGTLWAEDPAPEDEARALVLASSHTLDGHRGLVRTVAFAPGGGRLATGGADRSLRLWNPATGEGVASEILPRGG